MEGKKTWQAQTHRLDRAQCRQDDVASDGVHPEDEAKAAQAYEQLKRGEIDGVLVTRMPSGRLAVKRMPRVLED